MKGAVVVRRSGKVQLVEVAALADWDERPCALGLVVEDLQARQAQ